MFRFHAGAVDYAIIAVYFAVVLGIGFAARRAVHSGLDFFLSGRSLPGVDHRAGLHRRQPGRPGDPQPGRQRGQYITLGGLSSAIYNEVLQFFVILAGLVPLTVAGRKAVGGWSGLQDKVTQAEALGPLALHPWEGTGVDDVTNPIGANWVAIVFGLGSVLSFGYCTTNFAEVQRALAAKNLSGGRR